MAHQRLLKYQTVSHYHLQGFLISNSFPLSFTRLLKYQTVSHYHIHYKGTILLFTSDCKTHEMEGEAKSKNRGRKLWHFYAHFPKGGKTKTKMDDVRQDSQTGLPTEYFALCSEASCFSTSVLIGTPVHLKIQYHQYT